MPRLNVGTTDWRLADDADFIADLTDTAPRLARAKRAWPRDPDAAKRLVVEHFCKRRQPQWVFDYRRKPAKRFPTRNYFWGEAIGLDEAEPVLRGRIRDPNCRAGYHDLGPNVDWRRGLIDNYGSSGWLVLHFWYWGLFAAAGYAMTRDLRYAEAFEKYWRRWHEDFPFYVEPDVVNRGGAFSRADSCMRAGRRMLVLTDVLYSGLPSALDTSTAFDVIKYLWFVSKQYLRLPRTRSGRFVYGFSNHNLFDMGTTPYCIAVMFPEFPQSERLVELGRANIRRHVQRSIHPDGTSREHSSRYAWYVGSMHAQALEIARLNRDRLLLPAQERKVRKFLWTLVELTAPDGKLIPYGDCQPPPNGLHLKTYRTLFDDGAAGARAEAFGLSLVRTHAPASGRTEDEPPGLLRRPWRVFRDSGMVLVRDGVGPDASMLWIVADPRGHTAHGHLDFTSFQLWVNGEALVHDTSGYAYRIETIAPDERAFYYSPFGHSLLTVDDYSPVPLERLGDVHGWWGNDLPKAVIEDARIRGMRGRVICTHRAYPGMEARRTFAFRFDERWVQVTDEIKIDSSARGAHAFRQMFHLGFGVRPRCRRTKTQALVRADAVTATFTWEGAIPMTISAEKHGLLKRAADVFRLAPPYVLAAQVESKQPHVLISCRIKW